ncbi:hypothetical protein TNCV_1010651 [Trichonephila clavipes]|nr:hypothetical protein TNCV_1010651 [Trichonephila clavipes]
MTRQPRSDFLTTRLPRPLEVRHRASTSAQDPYRALSARRHKRTTALQVARDFAAVTGRISRQTAYSYLAQTGL